MIVVDVDLSKKAQEITSDFLKKSKSAFFKYEQYVEIQKVIKAATAGSKKVPHVIFLCTHNSGGASDEHKSEFSRFEKICEQENWYFKHIYDEAEDLETKLSKLYVQVESFKLVGVERKEPIMTKVAKE